MVMNKTIKTLIFVIFINNCYGNLKVKPKVFKIFEKSNKIFLQNDESSGYNPKELLKFVQHHGDIEYNLRNILNKNKTKYPDGKHPLGTNRILAKRIVPPGQITPDFEYDKQYETYFKPLVKLHKVKKMANQETNLDVSSDSHDLSLSESDESEQDINYYNNNGLIHKSNKGLQELTPREKKESQSITKKQEKIRMSIEEQGARFLKDIQEMTHLIKNKRQKNIIKDKVSVVVQELENLHGNLFDLIEKTYHLRQQPNTATLPPYADEMPVEDDINTPLNKIKKHPILFPNNPFWNFWTVRQTIKL